MPAPADPWRRSVTRATCTASGLDGAPVCRLRRAARQPRRCRLHHRHGPEPRRCLAGADRSAHQHRPGPARCPDIASRVAGISFMGGGLYGNRTATAEFNIWADPEAAAIVLAYGGPLIMAGLDVTHQFQATPGTHRAVSTSYPAGWRRHFVTCCGSSAPTTSSATRTSPAPRCTIRSRCWR